VVAGAVGLALAGAGCGKAKESASPAQGGVGGKSLSRAELIAQADAICSRVNVKRNAVPVRTMQDFARILPPISAYEKVAFAEMAKLRPPATMAGTWTQIVSNAQLLADSTAKLGQYAAKHTRFAPSSPLIATFRLAQQRLYATALHAGFKACSEVT
jgi:hypothetical protein